MTYSFKPFVIQIVLNTMKNIYLLLTGLLLLSFTLSKPSGNRLVVKITGFSSNTGKAHIAVFRKGDDFPELDGQYKAKIVEISNKTATASFENLPTGSYAVAVFHDKNKNGVMDKNMVGAPTEDYGFSNNARGTFSAPSFEEASFKLEKEKTISILVK